MASTSLSTNPVNYQITHMGIAFDVQYMKQADRVVIAADVIGQPVGIECHVSDEDIEAAKHEAMLNLFNKAVKATVEYQHANLLNCMTNDETYHLT